MFVDTPLYLVVGAVLDERPGHGDGPADGMPPLLGLVRAKACEPHGSARPHSTRHTRQVVMPAKDDTRNHLVLPNRHVASTDSHTATHWTHHPSRPHLHASATACGRDQDVLSASAMRAGQG